MYGTLLSVLLLGVLPLPTSHGAIADFSREMGISAPALASADAFLPLDGRLTASGAIIIDLESGQLLYDRGASQLRPMASLTKLMTALIIVEHHGLDETVTVSRTAADTTGTTAHLPEGEVFTVGDLLSAMLIPSGNDAAVALAEYHAGSVPAFVEEMNIRAKELGLKHTSYENPVGLDDSLQQSTARDLAWLAMFVLRHEPIRDRMSMAEASIRSRNGVLISLSHTHRMIESPVTASATGTGAIVSAGKTGTTDSAGQCLLSVVKAGGRAYVVVLLGSRDRYSDMQKILDSFES